MRSVRQVGKTLVLLCGSAAWTSCANIDDITVGALEQDAGSDLESPPATSPADGSTQPPLMTPDAGRDAGTGEEPGREDEDDRRELEARDAGSAPDAALATEAGTLDAGPLASDAGSDTVDANAGLDAGGEERDGSANDAGTDPVRSLLCTLEPWHCL